VELALGAAAHDAERADRIGTVRERERFLLIDPFAA
jgi:hypothetical protein